MYQKFVKRLIDLVLSTVGIIILLVPMLIISLIIVIEDPGPPIFKQKRIGKNKKLFNLYKFRSMKMNTPHDVPTHLLENPEQYLLKSGKIFRKLSIDELPQIFNIFGNKMSLVGPRPALWNQYDLCEERDKYGANDVKPGLTGWAQVNGRDELLIPDKARLDGEYVKNLSFKMDWTCFWMTVGNVLKSKGVVEGGTGAMAGQFEKRKQEVEVNK